MTKRTIISLLLGGLILIGYGESGIALEQSDEPIKICVGGMVIPEEGFGYYKQLFKYIGNKLERPVKFIDKRTYAEVNALVQENAVDLAFVCGGPYVDGKKEFDMELLVAPVMYNDTVYHSYIIVPEDSPAESLNDLKGKDFAFTDPMSNTGCLVPTYMLSTKGENPETFFSEIVYTYAHDKSIRYVARRAVDGAAVDSLIWEYQNSQDPSYTGKTKIIAKSEPYGIPPVVVPQGLDPVLKNNLKDILLNAHLDDEGAKILKNINVEKFVVIDDSAYNTIRHMKDFIKQRKTVS